MGLDEGDSLPARPGYFGWQHCMPFRLTNEILIFESIYEDPYCQRTPFVIEPTATLLRSRIDFESTAEYEVQKIRILGSERMMLHSKPFWYAEANREMRKIDRLILGSESDDLEGVYRAMVEKAALSREKTLARFSRDIGNFFETRPEVLGVLGIGSVFLNDRLADEGSDIDLMVFVAYPPADYVSHQELVADICTRLPEYAISVSPFWFDGTDWGAAEFPIRTPNILGPAFSTDPALALEVYSYDCFESAVAKAMIPRYFKNALIRGRVIKESGGCIGRLTDLMEGVR